MENEFKVIPLAGHQYLVKRGSRLTVNRLGAKEGGTLEVKDLVSKEPVELKLVEHKKGKKIRGMTFKPKTRYTRRYGHRQLESVVEVTRIGQEAESKKPVAKKVAKTGKIKKTAFLTKTAKKSTQKKEKS